MDVRSLKPSTRPRNIYIEFNVFMSILFFLFRSGFSCPSWSQIASLTVIRSASVCANVGIGCPKVRAFSRLPCQFCSRMRPVMLVVRSSRGSWNIISTPSKEMCISEGVPCLSDNSEELENANSLPLSMPSAPSAIAREKEARVFSGKAADAFKWRQKVK